MQGMISIDDSQIPSSYLEDSMPHINATYEILTFTKHDANEKEISQVYISEKKSKHRVGWLIPILSIISLEHDYVDSIYFKKHAYEICKKFKGKIFHENTYFLVVSERLWKDLNGDLSKESLFVSLAEFGLYPKGDENTCASYKNSLAKSIDAEIIIDLSFCIHSSESNYISELIHGKLKHEKNEYARFMYIYQVFELSMEFIFYQEMNEFRRNKNHLGIIRDKFAKLSSENKLITLIYDKLNLNALDIALNSKVKTVLGDLKGEDYYCNSYKAQVIYDIRNSLVHSYFRFNIQGELRYFCDYLEMEFYEIMKAFYHNSNFRDEFVKEYFTT